MIGDTGCIIKGARENLDNVYRLYTSERQRKRMLRCWVEKDERERESEGKGDNCNSEFESIWFQVPFVVIASGWCLIRRTLRSRTICVYIYIYTIYVYMYIGINIVSVYRYIQVCGDRQITRCHVENLV